MLSRLMTRDVKAASRRPNFPTNRLRIIGGRWRGVPIVFPPLPQVRPTPDRVRETIFNWLQSDVLGADCLDLFAGSGALGFEALSRGAKHVVFVDRDPKLADHLRQTATKLRAADVEIIGADALVFLQRPPRQFKVVFLDPPYALNVLSEVCSRLAQGWLAPNALVYLEATADAGLPALPSTWSVHRSKQAGQVGYHLLRAN